MGRSEVEEVLVELQPGRSLRYELRVEAGPFASAASRWSTERAPRRGTVVRVEGFFRAKHIAVLLVWPFARFYLRRVTRGVLRELEAFLVAGGRRTSGLGRSH